MKKIITVLIILIIFVGCNKIDKNPVTIDKTTFETYSKTLLIAMDKSVKEEKSLDVKIENDLKIYIDKYNNEINRVNADKITDEQKYIADDVWLTSLNLKYLLEAVKNKDSKNIKIQHKMLTDILSPYNL